MFRTLVRRALPVFILFIICVATLSLASPQLVAASNQPAKPYYDLTDAPTIAVDWNNAAMQTVALGGNRKFSFTGAQPGRTSLLSITHDAHASRTVTSPPDVRRPRSTPPTLTPTAHT